MKKITPSEYYKAVRNYKNAFAQIKKVNQEKTQKLLKSKKAKIIQYPEYKESFDYVEKKYPGLNVLSVTIYEVPHSELEDIGLGGAGGLYIFSQKAVVISDSPSGTFDKNAISAKLSKDEIIVHELCHYVSHKFSKSDSVIMEEEFAYGNSVPYLISKGYSDKDIIKHNMLPFLYEVVEKDSIFKEVLLGKKITKSQFNTILRSYKSDPNKYKDYKKIISEVNNDLHKKITEKAFEVGQFLVDKYREIPDGELTDDDNDYEYIDI